MMRETAPWPASELSDCERWACLAICATGMVIAGEERMVDLAIRYASHARHLGWKAAPRVPWSAMRFAGFAVGSAIVTAESCGAVAAAARSAELIDAAWKDEEAAKVSIAAAAVKSDPVKKHSTAARQKGWKP